MIEPKIAILMINHNRDQYISAAIQSVIDQTEPNWELVIVDDASTDRSWEIISGFSKDERIKIFRFSKQQGIGRARRKSVKLASASLLAILDSDDTLTPEAAAEMIKAHSLNPGCFIYSQQLIGDERLENLKLGTNGPISESSSNLVENKISHFVCFKRSDYESAGGYNPRLSPAEDKDLYYKLEEVCKPLFIDMPLYKYRRHKQSASSFGWRYYFAAWQHCRSKLAAYQRRKQAGSEKQLSFFLLCPLIKKLKIPISQVTINSLKRFLDKFYFPWFIKRAQSKLANLEKNAQSDTDLFALANKFRCGLPPRGLHLHIRPAQVPLEILALMKKIRDLKPPVILEIGTATGGTLYLFTKIAPPSATLISLDLPEGPFGGGYLSARQKIMESFPGPNQSLHLLQSNSHSPETKKAVLNILAGRPVDFLFIDGDHSYEGAKADWLDYSGLVRPGGLVAFHDIVPNPSEQSSQVNKLWAELKNNYDCQEIVADPKQGWAGLGLIQL